MKNKNVFVNNKSLRMSHLTMLLLAATCLTAPRIALAQVNPANNATQVYNAPNGVPIVDIANPNANGLSHNQYNNYNVDARGLVLNNGDITQISRASQLAGQVPANLNLANQATVILNEVVSPNRSTLAGFTEVVGGAADVIVANPYGITCNGCGFINAPQATLTTGAPTLTGGALTGFRVENGDVLITGTGLDASAQDYLALMGRAVKLDGQVNAKDLDVSAGAQDWDRTTRTATPRAAGGAAPAIAIDSSALGGMYANRIRLIATEGGVGVRMNGEAAAGTEDFTITATGKVEVNNKISANRDVNITSTASGADAIHVNNTTIAAKRHTEMTANAGQVHLQGGTITADENLTMTSASLDDSTTAGAGDNNKRYAGKNLTLNQTGTTTLSGTSYGAGEIFTGSADTVTLGNGTKIYGDTVALHIGTALNNNAGAEIFSAGDLTIRGRSAAAYDVHNYNKIEATNLLDIKGFGGGNAVNIYTDAANATYIGNTAAINSTLLSLVNNSGLTTQGNATISTTTLTFGGTGSYVVMAKSGTGTGAVTVGSTFVNNAILFSGGNLTLNGVAINNTATGGMGANGTLRINATGNVDNYGAFFAGALLDVSAPGRNFTNWSTGKMDSTLDMAITADVFRNNNDVIAGRNLTVTARQILNEIPGGDTRAWNPTKTYTVSNALCNPYVGRANCFRYDYNEETTAGLVYDETWYYHIKWYEDQYYTGITPTASDRPVLAAGTTAGSTLTLKSFDRVHNLGGIISGHAIQLTGNGGSQFINDAYDLKRISYVTEWDIHCDRDLATDSCDWTYPTVALPSPRRIVTTSALSTFASGQGASVLAHTITGTNFGLTNTASTHTATPGTPTTPTGATGGFTVPTNPNGFFVPSKNPNSKYLVETNPLFTDPNAMGSDYLAKRFGIDPDLMQRRLGDANYETYLVRQQLIAQMGNTIITGGESEAQQMQRLMDNGADTGKALGLTFGQAPSATQLANLANDMVWMVETEVNGEKVLAPVVYLSQATKDSILTGAVISANKIDLSIDSLDNIGGTIQGSDELKVASLGDITNLSGTIRGGDVSLESTNGNIVNKTYSNTTGDGLTMQTDIGKTASIESTGNLKLKAANDITNIGANVSAGGNADLDAGRNITFDTIEDKRAETTRSQSGGAFDRTTTTTTETSTTHIRSGLTVGGDLNAKSKNDTTFAGTDVKVGGNADVDAGGNLNIVSRDDTKSRKSATSGSGLGVGGGVYGTTTTTTEDFQSRNKGTNFEVGGNGNLKAGETLTIQGSNVSTGGDMTLEGKDVKIVEGRDIDSSKTTTETTTFGKVDMGEGFTVDKDEEDAEETDRGPYSVKVAAEASTGRKDSGGVTLSETTLESTTHNKSTAVGSSVKSGGNMVIKAIKDVFIRGSDVESAGDVDVSGENVIVTAAQNIEESTHDKTVAKVGLYGTSDNNAGASAEAEAYATADGSGAPTAGAGVNAEASASTANTLDLVRVDQTKDTTKDVTHTGSTIKSGGKANITADNKLTVHGSDLESGGDMTLKAKDMAFTAAQDSHTETHEGSHTRAGLYADTGASADAGASASAQGMTAGAGASANAEANAGVGLYASNTTEGSALKTTTAKTSSIKSGGNLTRTADKNITDVGTQIETDGDFTQTSESWDSKAAENTSTSSSTRDSHEARIGVYADASAGAYASADSLEGTDQGAGATASVGVAASYTGSSSDKSAKSSDAVVSNIKSGGNMKTTTTGKTSLEGTNLDAAGDMTLEADSLDYKAARNTASESDHSTDTNANFKLGIDVTKAVTGELSAGHADSKSSSSSSTAVVGGMNSGGNLKIKTKNDATFEGTNIESANDAEIDAGGNVKFDAARDTSESSSTDWNVDAGVSVTKNKAKKSGGQGVELSGGYQTSEEQSDQAVAGSIKSGGDLKVKSGKDATFEGTKLESGKDMSVEADGDVSFNAAESTASSSGWGVEASLSGSSGGTRGQNGKMRNREKEADGGISGGYNQSDETTSDVSTLKSGGNLQIKSGNNVNLEGTEIEADGSAKIKADKDVNITAATNTAHSVGVSAGAKGIITKEGADEDGNGVKFETKTKGKAGFELSGEDSTTKTGGSIKAKTIEITSGNDTNLEGTKLNSKGDTTIDAGGAVNMKAAKSDHIKGGIGLGVGKESVGVTQASIDGGVDNQGVEIKSGNDVNIKSGGKTLMEGTKIEADGDANIDAKGGVEKKSTTSANANIGMDHAGGGYESNDVEITEHKEDNSAVGDDSNALKAVFAKMNEGGENAAPPSPAQNDIVNEIERIDLDESLTPAQKEKKRAVLEDKLENQKAIDVVTQDTTLNKAQKSKLLKELKAKQKALGE